MTCIVCLAHFCEVHGPCSIMSTQISDSKSRIVQKTSVLQTCSSCKLILPNNATNIITESDNKIFLSTQYPSNQEQFTALMKLVMKSLSVETISDITKPLFIGDNGNGYTITKVFKVKDLNARGEERKYSLMVINDDEYTIIKNWEIISSYLDQIIESFQLKVNSIHNRSQTSLNNNDIYLRRSLVKPKSLVELTEDDNTFVKLHLTAVELIKDILS